MNTDNRISPQTPEIEEAILGACRIEVRSHQLIYSALLAMHQSGTKILRLNKLLVCALDETRDIADTMAEAERRIAQSVNRVTGIPTGLTELDRMTAGIASIPALSIRIVPIWV